AQVAILRASSFAKPRSIPFTFQGTDVGALFFQPSPGMVGTGTAMIGGSFNPDNLIDRKQLTRDHPNVVVINLSGELMPTPFEVAEKIAGTFSGKGAFARPDYAKVSGVLIYNSNSARQLLPNPKASIALTEDENEFFERAYPSV
ncbi:MAG: hypothetical protein ACT4PT_13795, partial [Methanobacteriota archaeon]